MIFTSYFAQVKKLKTAGIVPVSIARYNPDWFYGKTIIDLAPTSNMLKMDDATYDKFYYQILNKLKAENIIERIKKLGDGRHVALLCYEADPKDCHRIMAGQWLIDAGFRVQEFGAAERSRAERIKKAQLKLF